MRGNEEKSKRSKECCMCGDYGLSHELLLCRSCRLRSQHRYCSNIYPNSDSYDICNWCLVKSSQSSCNKSTTFRRTNNKNMIIIRKREISHNSSDVKKRPKRVSSAGDDLNGVNGVRRDNGSSSSLGTKGRIIMKGKAENQTAQLRRTKSGVVSNQTNIGSRVIVKNLSRNHKLRKYKLLDEVSH